MDDVHLQRFDCISLGQMYMNSLHVVFLFVCGHVGVSISPSLSFFFFLVGVDVGDKVEFISTETLFL